MAVLIEAINVVVQLQTLRDRYPGGIQGYQDDCPNRSFCADNHLARVGFMQPAQMEAFVAKLDELGLCALLDNQFVDLAIVDQLRGPLGPCDWLEWGRHTDGFNLAWLAGTKPGPVVVPQGWTIEDSLRLDPRPTEDVARDRDGLQFIREDEDFDVFLDPATGKEVYERRKEGAAVRSASPAVIEKTVFLAGLPVVNSVVFRAHELEEAMAKARAEQDVAAAETIHAELTTVLLPRAEHLLGAAEDLSAAHYAHGVVLRVNGMYDDAAAAYARSLELAPDSVPTLMEMTICLGEANRPGDALPFARRAVELDGRSAAAWGNLAMIYVQMGDRAGARGSIDQALSLDPTDKKNQEISEHFEELFP